MRWLCVVGLLALSSCQSSSKKSVPAGESRRLNVVLVTIDTLRADRLGCYGYRKIETPNLDKLAQRGVLFENAVAQAPLTAPSHASIFTGTYPVVHKVRDTGGFVLETWNTTLAEILQQQGWETAGFVGASVLKKSFGFSQGFGVYDDRMPKPAAGAMASEYPERRAGEVVDRAVGWLESQSGKPFLPVGARVRSALALRSAGSVRGKIPGQALRRGGGLHGPAAWAAVRGDGKEIAAGEDADGGAVGPRRGVVGARGVHAWSVPV